MAYTEMKHLSIPEWNEGDRPREKLLARGASQLTHAELLAILLGSGSSKQSALELAKIILAEAGNDLSALAKLPPTYLTKIKGVGDAKAITIASALELGRRREEGQEAKKIQTVRSSHDVYQLFRPILMDLMHEEFWVLLLNRANRVMSKVMISKGGLAGTVADPKMIFHHALLNQASAMILVHNHPSGNLQPSQADRDITKKLRNAGDFLDLPVLDHLIVTEAGFFSFADEGII
ncbi:RadC family protein [Sanyastnella coralliicola]|uniref:RadC family protein n=1 Tax=Sanyastnella coralliicola TaxID=3069118 RepID=UPI0027B91E33|nr:DNA repair protein RadC [Longitalea sp. SCSIO 12813]